MSCANWRKSWRREGSISSPEIDATGWAVVRIGWYTRTAIFSALRTWWTPEMSLRCKRSRNALALQKVADAGETGPALTGLCLAGLSPKDANLADVRIEGCRRPAGHCRSIHTIAPRSANAPAVSTGSPRGQRNIAVPIIWDELALAVGRDVGDPYASKTIF